jgi:hypothetical protein
MQPRTFNLLVMLSNLLTTQANLTKFQNRVEIPVFGRDVETKKPQFNVVAFFCLFASLTCRQGMSWVTRKTESIEQ